MGKPYLGFCLGCQLLGEVIGGKVVQSNPAEIGVLDINMSASRKNDALFADFPDVIKALQWHSFEVQGLKDSAAVTLLGSSDTTRNQIFKYHDNAYAVQFHIEVKADTVRQWGCVPEYKGALENSLGANALESIDQQTSQQMAEMNRLATLLYENFKRLISAA